MATIGRGKSRSGTATRAKPARKALRTPDLSLEEWPGSGRADKAPIIEPDRDPITEHQQDPVIEPAGPNEALAASQSDLAKLQAARRARLIKAGAVTAIVLILIVFVLQNAQPTEMDLLFWTVSTPVIWVIVGSALLGALAGYLVGRPDRKLLLHGPSRRQEDTR
ncbi:MAG: LapA family protein [Acidimicrobiia bacterium]